MGIAGPSAGSVSCACARRAGAAVLHQGQRAGLDVHLQQKQQQQQYCRSHRHRWPRLLHWQLAEEPTNRHAVSWPSAKVRGPWGRRREGEGRGGVVFC